MIKYFSCLSIDSVGHGLAVNRSIASYGAVRCNHFVRDQSCKINKRCTNTGHGYYQEGNVVSMNRHANKPSVIIQ